MKKSKFIERITLNDLNAPGEHWVIDIHLVEGGVIGIQPEYVEEISNYISNPYQDCQVVLLDNSSTEDNKPFPPLEEDELYGFLKIVVAASEVVYNDNERKKNLASYIGVKEDQLEFLFGLAQDTLKELTNPSLD